MMPDNILLEEPDRRKVGHVRGNRVCDVRQMMTSGFGAMLYAGREMCDSADHTAAVDVYSFALIVYAERQSARPSRKTHPTPDLDHRLQEAATEMLRE
jgi:hypothetical protein